METHIVTNISVSLVILMVLFVITTEIGIRKKAIRSLRIILFVIYLCINIFLTLFREPTADARYALRLFWSWERAFHGDRRLLAEVLLNILLYVPFGFLLCDSRHLKPHPWRIVFFGFLSSTVTEVTQLVFHVGLFEFDDIFDNTLGCLLGVLCYRCFTRIANGALRKKPPGVKGPDC